MAISLCWGLYFLNQRNILYSYLLLHHFTDRSDPASYARVRCIFLNFRGLVRKCIVPDRLECFFVFFQNVGDVIVLRKFSITLAVLLGYFICVSLSFFVYEEVAVCLSLKTLPCVGELLLNLLYCTAGFSKIARLYECNTRRQ